MSVWHSAMDRANPTLAATNAQGKEGKGDNSPARVRVDQADGGEALASLAESEGT